MAPLGSRPRQTHGSANKIIERHGKIVENLPHRARGYLEPRDPTDRATRCNQPAAAKSP